MSRVFSDDDLLRAAQRGDAEALERLLASEQQRLYRFGLRMCGDEEDAKDILQESLLAAAKALPRFEGRASLATWLYTIARSFCIKKRRAGRSIQTHGAEIPRDLPDPRDRPDEELAAREAGRLLTEALLLLSPEHREVLVLRDVEGLPAAEVAEVLGIGVPAVKSRLHRARAAIRDALAPALAEPTNDAGCPDIVALYSRHLEDEISAETCAAMERHIAGCARCARACEDLKRVLDVCQSPAPEVPKPVQDSVRQALRALRPVTG